MKGKNLIIVLFLMGAGSFLGFNMVAKMILTSNDNLIALVKHLNPNLTSDQAIGVLGNIGSWFGGTVSPILTFVSFLGVLATLVLQMKQINDTKDDLARQRFETTFFQMVKLHNDIVQSLKFHKGASGYLESRECFLAIKQSLETWFSNGYGTQGNIISSYEKVYKDNQNILGHYFRNLYRIIKYIDESVLPHTDKNNYADIVRAQLSTNEQVLLMYNVISRYGEEKFLPLVHKYDLLDEMDRDALIESEHYNIYEMKLEQQSQ